MSMPSIPPLPPFLPVNSVPNVTNFGATNRRTIRKAIANVRAGTGRAAVGFVGNSTTAGAGAGTGGLNTDGAWPKSLVYNVAQLIGATGLPINRASVFGANVAIGNSALYDTRRTIPSGWVQGGTTIGGAYYANTTNSNVLKFAFTEIINEFDVYYLRGGAGGDFTVGTTANGVLATLNNNGAQGIVKRTFTASDGLTRAAQTIEIARSTGSTWITAVVGRDTTTPAVDVYQMGWYGSLVTNWASTANSWTAINAISTNIACDLWVIDLNINDCVGGTDLTTYATLYGNLLDKMLLTGSVLVMLSNPIGSKTLAEIRAYQNISIALAAARNLPVLDWTGRWVDYATAAADGYMADLVHPNAVGYWDIAPAILPLILGR